jgi:hypothetical protein
MSTQSIFNMVDSWNAAGTTFTAVKMNATDTASAAGSLLMDLQQSGTSRFKAAKNGSLSINTASFAAPAPPSDAIMHLNGAGTGSQTRVLADTVSTNTRSIFAMRRARDAGSGVPGAVQSGDQLGAFFSFGHDGTSYTSSSRAGFSFEATETYTLTANGTRIGITTTLNTTTAATTRFYFQGGFWTLNATSGDMGADTINASSYYANGNIIADTNALIRCRVYTVGTLPTGVAGARAFVSDANATTFASIVAGGGANGVPVYSDGTNWRIG